MTTTLPPTQNFQFHRQQFPGLTNKVYFNFGGQGTMPNGAMEAIIDSYRYIQQKGPFSSKVNSWINHRIQLTKEAIAREIGAISDTITLTENVTHGCNIVLWGIDWQQGDHILLTDCEHPGVIAIIEEICRRFGVEYSTCPIMATLNQGDPASVIAQNLQPRTKLVVLSHLLWNTGQVLPLEEIVTICHQKSVQVLVDGAQSVGCIPLKLSDSAVDFYAFTGHKWWCGPSGVGGLYISPRAFSSLKPTFIGWRGIYEEEAKPVGFKTDGSKFEVASSAYPLYDGLRGAIATHQEWGTPEQRAEQIKELSAYLWQNLAKIEGLKCLSNRPPDAGLISFQLTGNFSHYQAVQLLEKQGFFLRTIADPNCIRACVHYFTLREEIEQLRDEIQKLLLS
jgi:L-cysteine/cystine lyase